VNRTHQDVSRRSVLQGAAAAGLAATAVTALGAAASTAAASTANASTINASAAKTSADAAAPTTSLVVHVRDIKSGDIEVFSGTSQFRVRNRALARQIAQTIH
jgi:predicted nicotinamide N-methyase